MPRTSLCCRIFKVPLFNRFFYKLHALARFLKSVLTCNFCLGLQIRKRLRYLLGNLYDFDIDSDPLPYTDLLPVDQYMLHLLHEHIQKVIETSSSVLVSHVLWACTSSLLYYRLALECYRLILVWNYVYCLLSLFCTLCFRCIAIASGTYRYLQNVGKCRYLYDCTFQANSLYESYAIDTMLRQCDRFLVADLSAFYCSVTKDRCVIGFDDTFYVWNCFCAICTPNILITTLR